MQLADTHCHILPSVDDGAADIEETRKMLRMAYEEGTRCMIATPHYHPRRGKASPEILFDKLKAVRREAGRIGKDLKIFLGTEIYYEQDVEERLKSGQILTVNGGDYVLVEFAPGADYEYIARGITRIQMKGYRVILAHAERCLCMHGHMGEVERLVNMGVKIQVNASGMLGDSGRKNRRFIKDLLKRDLVFCVGSDAHDTAYRPPCLRKAAEYVKRKYGEQYMKRIFYENAMALLRSE